MTQIFLWLIPFFPLMGFGLNVVITGRLGKNITGFVACASVLFAFLVSGYFFLTLSDTTVLRETLYTWMNFGSVRFDFGLTFDRLSGLMALVITGIGFLIHVYSLGYMKTEEGHVRYFAFLNLFVFFMLILVLADNLPVMFIGWEGVGLCSYLLIGHYLKKTSAGNAAKKAFIMNRIGDFGLMAAMLIAFHFWGTLNFEELNFIALAADEDVITIVTLFLFLGAIGKSAQIPLYTWLPDAMEGPTPVSALIHAATMVTSGIYLVVRLGDLFLMSPFTSQMMVFVGAFTALIAAVIAIPQRDIKKVLAYSTVSQLGYMFMALGVGAFGAGMFHLLTHAFFKALLFLGAGSIIFALHHEQDMTKMGGMRTTHPFLKMIFSIGAWALAGLPFAAGFFSKDEILWKVASSGSPYVFIITVVGFLVSGLTAFYVYRLVNMVFYGEAPSLEQAEKRLSLPFSMRAPLAILAFFSLFIGLLGVPHVLDIFHFGHLLEIYFFGIFASSEAPPDMDSLEIVSIVLSGFVAFLGLLLARIMYFRVTPIPKKISEMFPWGYRLSYGKFYVNQIYDFLLVKPVYFLSRWICPICFKIVSVFPDGFLALFQAMSVGLGKLQSGLLHHYILVMFIGIIFILNFIF